MRRLSTHLSRYCIRCFHGTFLSTASVLHFSIGIEIRSDLQQTSSQRDGDCVGPVVRLKFIHQVLDVEVDRGL